MAINHSKIYLHCQKQQDENFFETFKILILLGRRKATNWPFGLRVCSPQVDSKKNKFILGCFLIETKTRQSRHVNFYLYFGNRYCLYLLLNNLAEECWNSGGILFRILTPRYWMHRWSRMVEYQENVHVIAWRFSCSGGTWRDFF